MLLSVVVHVNGLKLAKMVNTARVDPITKKLEVADPAPS